MVHTTWRPLIVPRSSDHRQRPAGRVHHELNRLPRRVDRLDEFGLQRLPGHLNRRDELLGLLDDVIGGAVGQGGGAIGGFADPGRLPPGTLPARIGRVGRAVADITIEIDVAAQEQRRVLPGPAADRRIVIAAPDGVDQAGGGVELAAGQVAEGIAGGLINKSSIAARAALCTLGQESVNSLEINGTACVACIIRNAFTAWYLT
jgi:hypothetical protein